MLTKHSILVDSSIDIDYHLLDRINLICEKLIVVVCNEEKAEPLNIEKKILYPFTLEELQSELTKNIEKPGSNYKSEGYILIVDDESEIREYIGETLNQTFETRLAIDGLDAINQISASQPEVILLDLKMPNMNGIETIKYLKNEMKNDSKIIVLTANTDPLIVNEALSLGADDFLDKTVSSSELTLRCINLSKAYRAEKRLNYLNEELLDNIQQIKDVETRLVLSEKKASISHMAKSILHELNNPINTSVFALRYIESVVDKSDTEEELFKPIRKAANEALQMQRRMAEILKNLKDYTASQDNAELSGNDIKEIINQSLELNKYELSGIEVIQTITESIVLCNKSEIMQVFTNLISNSKKAFDSLESPQTRTISISSKIIGNANHITFRDNGPGIPKNVIDCLFGEFYTKFKNNNSSGLGLDICQTILRKHNTKLTVTSDGCSYSEFSFDLSIIDV